MDSKSAVLPDEINRIIGAYVTPSQRIMLDPEEQESNQFDGNKHQHPDNSNLNTQMNS